MASRRDKTTTAPVPPLDLPRSPHESFNPGKSTILGLIWDGGPGSPKHREADSVLLGGAFEVDPNEAASTSIDGENTQGYEFITTVGEGGFGEVWDAVQRSLGRRIAIKRLRKELLSDVRADSYLARHLVSSFRQEALTTGALEHPNIVPVYDLGIDASGLPLMAMKMVRGRKWDDVIEQDFHLPAGEFLARHLPTLIGVGQAVAFAHSRGVVHRDIKPSQVMLGEFGEVLLMDWGLALVFDPGKAELQGPQLALSEFTPWSPRVTSPAGTPSYMAPEQTEEAAVDVGPWTDVFLLGGCLFYLLTGYAPHEEETSEASFRRAVKCEVELPSKRAPDRVVPEELEVLAMRALASERTSRPTALEFIDRLKDYLTGASRKREAAMIYEEAQKLARERLAEFADYNEMHDVANLLERTLLLDPDNKKAAELRHQVLLHFAKTAIANNDLRLASFHAERMATGRERQAILTEIQGLEAQQERAQKSLEHMYARAAEERNTAQNARSDAEQLIALMLQRLRENFGNVPDKGPLKTMTREALAYLTRFPDRNPSRESVKSRVSFFRAAGELFEMADSPEEALEVYRHAESLMKKHLLQEPGDEAFVASLTQLQKQLRAVHRRTVQSREEEKTVKEFQSAREKLLRQLDDMIDG